VDEEVDVFIQRIDAATGAQLGPNDHRISGMGVNPSSLYSKSWPDVSYNDTDREYLVVWTPLVDNPFIGTEILAQRVDSLGREVGADDCRISDMGPFGSTSYDALMAEVAYSHAENEYVVVWSGDDDAPPLVNDEFEIYGQRLSPSALEHFIAEAAHTMWDSFLPSASMLRVR
jgi:hypothetical protein